MVKIPIFWSILVLTTGSITIIGSVLKKIKTLIEARKESNLVQNIQISLEHPVLPNINNQAHNPPLLSDNQTKIVCTMLAVTITTLFVVRLSGQDMVLEMVMGMVMYNLNGSIFGFIFPILIFMTKKDFRSYISHNF